MEHIASLGGDKFAPNVPLEAGVLDARCGRGCLPFMEGSNVITNTEAVSRVIQGERVTTFMENFLAGEVITFDHKWLRGVHKVIFKEESILRHFVSRMPSLVFTWTMCTWGGAPVSW